VKYAVGLNIHYSTKNRLMLLKTETKIKFLHVTSNKNRKVFHITAYQG
jgi:hypothetical protein